MLLLKYMLLATSVCLFGTAAALLVVDLLPRLRGLWRPRPGDGQKPPAADPTASGWRRLADGAEPFTLRWQPAARLAALAWVPLLIGLAIVVIPSGMAAVRVSQISGTLAGTLYPGTHLVVPLVQHAETYGIRDRIYSSAAENVKTPDAALKVQSKEGLVIGLGVSVRYRLDPQRLPYVHASLPENVDVELVPPVVASVFRQTIPNYTVREVFSAKREEVRRSTAEAITRKLAGDGILVKEVLLRDIVLPPEYAKGIEGLLLKEQENERLGIELEVKAKEVQTAELEAEAEKVREVKRAEAQAAVTVLQAKAQADAMQHTLPLKEKQIQQTRLEAEARKESTVKNAEAQAEAKVIDSRAEAERQNLMAKVEEQRIRLLSGADAERMRAEAQVLKDNPLLIQKIIAEKLSDKVQIMMVPMDGKFFFANDVLRGPQLGMNANSPR
jgi:regulator of protease activity HflC (stomatin/prohibitin superfamily)